MSFDWILFLGISVIGPYFGGKICAALEKRVTGKVRKELEFRNKRVKSTLISIALGYITTLQIMSKIPWKADHYSDSSISALSVLIGVCIYLVIQMILYQILLLKSKRM